MEQNTLYLTNKTHSFLQNVFQVGVYTHSTFKITQMSICPISTLVQRYPANTLSPQLAARLNFTPAAAGNSRVQYAADNYSVNTAINSIRTMAVH